MTSPRRVFCSVIITLVYIICLQRRYVTVGTLINDQTLTRVEVVKDETAEDKVIFRLNNVHKTYLLGIEGVPALRYAYILMVFTHRGVNVEAHSGEVM